MTSIEIKNLDKKFYLGKETTTAFKTFKNFFLKKKFFWGLKQITVSLKANERVALIGANGSGKTTLLRILAGIYKPTNGEITTKGKVAAFLQTYVAMEDELNTIDNIYILGNIYGIPRKKVRANIDEIINYAGLKKFAYCPVRELSSGMTQRLIMSIIRYVEADIFLFDELFESGDLAFKEKFYKTFIKQKINGRILIITTHDQTILNKFCTKGILLDRGKLIAQGQVKSVLEVYDHLSEKNF